MPSAREEKRRLIRAALAGLVTIVSIKTSAAVGADYQWNTPAGGSWSDAANWKLIPSGAGAVPGDGNQAVIATSSGTIVLSANSSSQSVYILDGATTLDLKGFNFKSGFEPDALVIARPLGGTTETPHLSITSSNSGIFPGNFLPQFGSHVQIGQFGSLTLSGSNLFFDALIASVDVGVAPGTGSAVLNVNNGALFGANKLRVGASLDGELNFNSGAHGYASIFDVGAGAGVVGTSNFSNSSFSAYVGILGGNGAATLNVRDNSYVSMYYAYVGGGTGAGNIVVSDPGTQLQITSLNFGYNNVSGPTTGTGSLTVNAGTASIGGITAGGAGHSVILNGGTLILGGGPINNVSTFNVGNGTDAAMLHIQGNVSSATPVHVSNQGALWLTHGKLRTPDLTADPGSTILWSGNALVELTNPAGNTISTTGALAPLMTANVLDLNNRGLLVSGGALTLDGVVLRTTRSNTLGLDVKSINTINGGALDYQGGVLRIRNQDLVVGTGGITPALTLSGFPDSIKLDTGNLIIDGGQVAITNGGELILPQLSAAVNLPNSGKLLFERSKLTVAGGNATIGLNGIQGADVTIPASPVPSTTLNLQFGSIAVSNGSLYIADGYVAKLNGGKLKASQIVTSGAAGGGRVDFGTGGVVDVATFTTDSANPHNVINSASLTAGQFVTATTVNVTNGDFTLDGGLLMARSALNQSAGNRLVYGSGTLLVNQNFTLGGATGVKSDHAITDEFTLVAGDQVVAANIGQSYSDTLNLISFPQFIFSVGAPRTLSLADNAVLKLDGGQLVVGTLSLGAGASFDFTKGRIYEVGNFDVTTTKLFSSNTITLTTGQELWVSGESRGSGSINVNTGAVFRTYSLDGALHVNNNGGTVEIYRRAFNGSSDQSSNIVAAEIAIAGSLKLSNAFQTVGKVVLTAGGLLSGNANVQGGGALGGTVSPGNSPGTLAFTEDVSFDASTVYIAEIGETTSLVKDLVSSAKTMILAGELDIDFLAGYVPQLGDTFTIIDAKTLVGTFQTIDLVGLTLPGLKITTIYDRSLGDVRLWIAPPSAPDTLEIAATPEPAAMGVLALASLAMLRRKRRAS